MRNTVLFSAIAALMLVSAPASAQSNTPPNRTIRSVPPVGSGDRQLVCRGAAVPAGWLVTDDIRDRQMCSGDNPTTLNLYNVWVIERFDNRPSGSVVEVCAGAPTPPGWVLVDVFRNKERCGHPEDVFAVNMKRIRRQ